AAPRGTPVTGQPAARKDPRIQKLGRLDATREFRGEARRAAGNLRTGVCFCGSAGMAWRSRVGPPRLFPSSSHRGDRPAVVVEHAADQQGDRCEPLEALPATGSDALDDTIHLATLPAHDANDETDALDSLFLTHDSSGKRAGVTRGRTMFDGKAALARTRGVLPRGCRCQSGHHTASVRLRDAENLGH